MNTAWQPFFEIIEQAERQLCTLRGDLISKDKLVIKQFMDTVPYVLEPVYRAALAAAKWHPDRLHPGGAAWSTCSFCVEYKTPDRGCNIRCPLVRIGNQCVGLGYSKLSLFQKWAQEPTRENATVFFQVLHSLYVKEFRKIRNYRKDS